MTKVRSARRNKGFESISRDMLQQADMPALERVVLAVLQSLPPEFEVGGVQGLVDQFFHADGYYKINNAIKGLEARGMFARLKRQGAGGKWEWLWAHDYNPADVALSVADWRGEEGYELDADGPRRGGNRQAKPPTRKRSKAPAPPDPAPPDDPVSPGQTVLEKSEHGDPADVSPGRTVLEKSVDGQPAHGSSVDGESRNKRDSHSKSPLPPRTAGGTAGSPQEETPAPAADPERCDEHDRRVCRPCGLRSTRGAQQREREQTAAELMAEERAARACSMCFEDSTRPAGTPPRWLRRDAPGSARPMTPYVVCDHVTPADVVRARLDERDRSVRPAQDGPARGHDGSSGDPDGSPGLYGYTRPSQAAEHASRSCGQLAEPVAS